MDCLWLRPIKKTWMCGLLLLPTSCNDCDGRKAPADCNDCDGPADCDDCAHGLYAPATAASIRDHPHTVHVKRVPDELRRCMEICAQMGTPE